MNNWSFTGHIGQDCKVESTGNGTPVCKFSVAVTSGYGENKETTWVNCLIFGKRAQGGITQYLKKGQQVAVCGEATLKDWQNSQGEQKSYLKVVVGSVDLVGGQNSQQQAPQRPAQQSSYTPPHQRQAPQNTQPQPAQQGGGYDNFDDDIPF